MKPFILVHLHNRQRTRQQQQKYYFLLLVYLTLYDNRMKWLLLEFFFLVMWCMRGNWHPGNFMMSWGRLTCFGQFRLINSYFINANLKNIYIQLVLIDPKGRRIPAQGLLDYFYFSTFGQKWFALRWTLYPSFSGLLLFPSLVLLFLKLIKLLVYYERI